MNEITPTLKIDLHTIRLRINQSDDYIEFNANDILFIEGFYQLIEQFQLKHIQYQAILDKTDVTLTSASGMPVSAAETIAAMKDLCQYAHKQINVIFGDGSSKKLFNDVLAFEPIEQFFEGITPYIREQRSKRLMEFLPPKKSRARKKRS